jgi:hypothetical protein
VDQRLRSAIKHLRDFAMPRGLAVLEMELQDEQRWSLDASSDLVEIGGAPRTEGISTATKIPFTYSGTSA